MKPWSRKRQEGVAAVELAIIYVTMFAIIPFVFLIGRLFLQYNVIKHAAFDAAQYVASSGVAKLSSSIALVKMNAHLLVERNARAAGQVDILNTEVTCKPSIKCAEAETIEFIVIASITDYGFLGLIQEFFGDGSGEYTFQVAVEVPNASRGLPE